MSESDTFTHLPPEDAKGRPGDDADFPVVEPGHYTVGAEFARGGQGRILTAQDLRLHRQVAIKELRLSGDTDWRKRFRREILITARLQHPSVVPIYEAGVWPNGQPFYAMKLVTGRPLDKVVAGLNT